jgi:ABC-type transport system involved in multi-copper enzyme maturation permease subunit
MRNPTQTTFGAIFQNEVLVNSRRVAPYVLMVLFSGNAVLWSIVGAAVARGWATNSDFYIVRNFLGFCFITGLPLFAAMIMGDPVIRDFRLGIDPLIFSKPVSRASYLLGKFFGNFLVLVCCQAAFALTLFLLQVIHTSRMVVLPMRAFPYFKHFFFFVVISYLVFAAVYFTVGTLTRNSKIVYATAVCFYPLYIAYQAFLLKGLPQRWRVVLDPLLFNREAAENPWERSADYLNQMVVAYSSDMIVNRALLILISAVCLAILYFRFSITERPGKLEKCSTLGLSTTTARKAYYDSEVFQPTRHEELDDLKPKATPMFSGVLILEVNRANEGFAANLNKLIAALGVEFRLLRAERSLIVLLPLAIFLSTLELAFYAVVPEVSYSATYASITTKSLLFFLSGMTVFYVGEAMHRDREVRIDSLLWATPAPNHVFLLSKFLAVLSLTLTLIAMAGLSAISIQLLRGHTPIEIPAFLITYSVILLPGLVFLTGLSIALNVLLRDKYLTYAVSIGTAAAMYYLYSQGYNHWLYNPLLYQLWNYTDLTGAGSNQGTILMHRLYCLAIASACLALAHLFISRKSTKGLKTGTRPSSNSWSVLVFILSVAIATILGLMISARW